MNDKMYRKLCDYFDSYKPTVKEFNEIMEEKTGVINKNPSPNNDFIMGLKYPNINHIEYTNCSKVNSDAYLDLLKQRDLMYLTLRNCIMMLKGEDNLYKIEIGSGISETISNCIEIIHSMNEVKDNGR